MKAKLILEDGNEFEGTLVSIRDVSETTEIWSDGRLTGRQYPTLAEFAISKRIEVILGPPIEVNPPSEVTLGTPTE